MPEITDKELALFERLKTIFIHAAPERSGMYFICGEGGEKDLTGLPERIMVCPAYGVDANLTKIYKRIDKDGT